MLTYFKEGEVEVTLHQGDFQVASDDLTATVAFLQDIVMLRRAVYKTETILGPWANWQRGKKKSVNIILECTIK